MGIVMILGVTFFASFQNASMLHTSLC